MLNQRQERFCLEYFTNNNATEAAKKAGYSERTAVVIASENLTKPKILARLQELRDAAQLSVVSNKQKKLAVLENIYAHEPLPETITARDRIHAVSEHNKMEGDYAPEKHAVLGDIEITIVHRDK